jgi:glycosyltransferase involved in cell wall biosynthesis
MLEAQQHNSVRYHYRIALVIDSLAGGGAERVVIELAQAFIDAGHVAVIISLQTRQQYQPSSAIPVHFLYTEARVKLYKKADRDKHASKLTALLHGLEREHGQFDLILSNLDEAHFILSACHFQNVRYLVHNAITQTLKRAIKMGPAKYLRQRRLFKCLNHQNVVAVSKGLAKELGSLSLFRPSSVKQIYNPFDYQLIARLAQKKNHQLPDQEYIIHVGRLAKQKRHDNLFSAMEHLPRSIKLVCLGENKTGILKLAKRFNLSSRVVAPGFQQNPYNWVANARCLVLSSDYEGFGNVLIEALACGTPVVSTDCEFGPNEILTGDLQSYLVPRNNPKALAEAILCAIQQPYPQIEENMFHPFAHTTVAMQYLDLIPKIAAHMDIK